MGALELELRQWLSQTPPFFHPKPESEAAEPLFYDVPWKFKRQQRTIQGAFFFANMLLYRGYLLREFLQQVPDTPRRGPCPARVAKCVENAMAMLALAAEFGAEDLHYNSTFWVSRVPRIRPLASLVPTLYRFLLTSSTVTFRCSLCISVSTRNAMEQTGSKLLSSWQSRLI